MYSVKNLKSRNALNSCVVTSRFLMMRSEFNAACFLEETLTQLVCNCSLNICIKAAVIIFLSAFTVLE